jgi:sialate O-acetylesterase
VSALPLLVSSHRGLCAAAGGGPCAGGAPFCLSNALGSSMVLQRAPAAAALWGFAPAGDDVVCALQRGSGGAAVAAGGRADAAGEWVVSLPPQPAGGPYIVTCSSAAHPALTLTLNDVLFGDVYLCSGQSNMVMSVHSMLNGSAEIEGASNFPSIRLMSVGQGTGVPGGSTPPRAEALRQLGTVQLPWSRASAATVGGREWTHFSAVCWVAGRSLSALLGGGVPIGLVAAAWGGSCIERWSPDDALEACGQPGGSGTLFAALMAPLARMRLAGVWWYQGESNVGVAAWRGVCAAWGAEAYACLFPALVAAWRAAFGAPTLFFAFVQLSPYIAPLVDGQDATRSAIAELREVQAAAARALPRSAMVTALDCGDYASPHRAIHPRIKAPLGERLAAATAAVAYGMRDAPPHAHPEVAAAVLLPSGAGARLTFHADTLGAGGLLLRPASCPEGVDARACAGWELQAPSGIWHAATAEVVESVAVAVTWSDVAMHADALAVRYAWANWPLASLFSVDGLPALPLRATPL